MKDDPHKLDIPEPSGRRGTMVPVLTHEEARRRGRTALNFYRELRDEGAEELEPFRLPEPAAARADRGIVGRVRRLLYAVFGP